MILYVKFKYNQINLTKFLFLSKITLGSIWLCVTGLLTNEEQQNLRNTETRLCAFKCVLELIKIEVSSI